MANLENRIAVMGATGTGKSTFIKLLTNDEKIIIGHSQQSETSDIQTSDYVDQQTGHSVMFIDTPGFDDSRDGVTDTHILEKIVQFLEPKNGETRKLNGLIYMHRISDPRVGGVSRKNLRMFQSLCGEESLRNVRIVTTYWSYVTEEEGNDREADLKDGAFKALLDAGAQMRRHTDTIESARQIISEIIPLEAVEIEVQKELRSGKELADTAAGKVLAAEIMEMQETHKGKMAELKEEVESAVSAQDLALRAEAEQQRKELEARIARENAEREEMQRTLERQRAEEAARRAEEEARMRRMREELEWQRRRREEEEARQREYQHQCWAREEAERRQQEMQWRREQNRRRAQRARNQNFNQPPDCVIC